MYKARYIVAVSGGVDSVVLLDKMRRLPGVQIMVAHFDHGIRPDSHKDELFVRGLAESYGLPFESRREELGSTASEATARSRRYAFLEAIAAQYEAKLVTAHHLDDMVETVAINLHRGTGWRGLAVFNAEHSRPLLDVSKKELIDHALKNKLEWREDPTNASDAYLRNRIRKKSQLLEAEKKRQLRALHVRQKELRQALEYEASQLVGDGPQYSRYFLGHMGDAAAIECLWAIFKGSLTRPQLARVLYAIKTARAGTVLQAGVGKTVYFSTRHFTV